jgi:hypothetical protein
LIKNHCRRLIKQGRKVNSNKIIMRGVIMGRSNVGRLPKIESWCSVKKLVMSMDKIEGSVV